VLGKGLLNEGGQVLLGCAGRFELAVQRGELVTHGLLDQVR
jgi:hypothetical protein